MLCPSVTNSINLMTTSALSVIFSLCVSMPSTKFLILQLRELPQSSSDLSMTKAEQERFEKLCDCRMARMPIQYIIGEWDFRELTLKMQPPVFIPRPETEELVELILQQYDVKESLNFLEVGCGSGCISLSLLYSLPKVTRINNDMLAEG